MATTASALPPPAAGGVAVADQEDSNISSPLSEVDDKDDNDDDVVEHMHLDHNDDDDDEIKVAAESRKGSNHTSDSDSVLSDAHSDVNSDGNITEAETERLYDTPRHQRQRDVIVDQFNEGQIFESTPSKLRRTAVLDEQADDELISGDEASIASSHPGDESPTKPVITSSVAVDTPRQDESQERKRKRSPGADQSETEQPLRKRTSSIIENEPAVEPKDEDTVMREGDETPIPEASGANTPLEDADRSPRKQSVLHEEETVERETRTTKKGRRGGKRKVVPTVEVSHEVEGDDAAGHDSEHHGESADADVDEEIDAAAAHDEELERKHSAYKDWTHIEEMFGIFRDRLYKDRLQRLEEEEQSLLAEVPTHPEYLNMKQCLDDRLEQKLKEINKELEYRFQALEKRAVAQRAQIWGQYYQAVREKRERSLEALNKEWYDVQTARRSAHSLQDCGLFFPKDPAQRVRNAIAYNTEVSTLASIAKYEGFPAGPELKGASAAELNDDLAAIEQSRRARQRPVVQPREDFHTPGFNRLGPAGEQFLKETPWANPNHSAHKIFQRAPAALDPRVDNTAGRGLHQAFVPVPADSKAPFESPNPNQRSPALSSRLSESPELARNTLNPPHQQVKRVGNLSGITANREPKATAT